MDNIQDTEQAVPQGQAAPAEQMPDVQSADVPAESQESSVETNFEAIAAKKGFKSPDDLAKAYANLESQNKKVEMAKADLEKMFFTEKPKSQPQVRQTLNADEQALAELDKYVGDKMTERETYLKHEFNTKLAKLELDRVIEKNPDFPKYAEDVKQFKSKYPEMSFDEAYTLSKAIKGDLQREAKSEGMKQSVASIQRQGQAQVAPEKKAAETKVEASEMLQGASRRWTPNARGQVDPRAKAEIEMLEKELFGTVLSKTPSGL